MIKKLLLGIGVLCLLAAPVLAFGADNPPVVPQPKSVKDSPSPTMPVPKSRNFCGSEC